MTPSHNERLIPSTLGKYEIIQRLAVGGMAELFLARVSGLEGFEKYVVVKRILPRYAQDKNFVDMFLDEARLAARLDHQNIVQVHDIGREDEAYFFAMQYLHGEDMQGIMKRMAHDGQILPLDKALTVISGVAAGLQYAHEKRDTDGLPLHIVHRDVAPSNILVTYEGGVKLVDFGIARAHFRRSQTEHGRVKGKLSYMSPEQCRGEELDGRSDIFALGIVMYELTTTSRLFPSRGGKKLAVMERIVNGDVPAPSSRIADYPPELEEILMRALRVSRAERYQRAGELLDDIELFAKNRSMSLSASSLAQWLRKTIGHRPEPWRVDRPAAPARDTGKVRRDDDDDERVMTEPKPKLSSDSDERRTTFKYNATPDRVAPAVKYTAIPEHSAPAVKHTATPEYTEPVTPAHLAAEDMQRVVAMRQQKSRRGTIALGLAVLAVVALIFTALHMGGSGTVPDSAANGHGVKASSEGDGTQPTSTDAAEATQGKARSDEASQNQRNARW
ncbi:MAG: serine/threonine-protein kinase [Myxococcota bacterium]